MSEPLKRMEWRDNWILTSESWEDGYQPYTTGEAAKCECGKHREPHWHHRCADGSEYVVAVNLKARVGVEEIE